MTFSDRFLRRVLVSALILGGFSLSACVAMPDFDGANTDSWTDERLETADPRNPPVTVPDRRLSSETRSELQMEPARLIARRDDIQEEAASNGETLSDAQVYADEARERAKPPVRPN